MTSRYIMHNGEKITLTYEQEESLRRQSNILTAQNAIENHCEFDVEYPDDDELASIGEDIDRRVHQDDGETEYYILEEHGLFENA